MTHATFWHTMQFFFWHTMGWNYFLNSIVINMSLLYHTNFSSHTYAYDFFSNLIHIYYFKKKITSIFDILMFHIWSPIPSNTEIQTLLPPCKDDRIWPLFPFCRAGGTRGGKGVKGHVLSLPDFCRIRNKNFLIKEPLQITFYYF